MRRRQFLGLAGGATSILLPRSARSRQDARPHARIGVLGTTEAGSIESGQQLAALEDGLRNRGWVQGHNLSLDTRWFGGDPSLMERYADELIAGRPDLLISRSDPALRALMKRSETIPIVFVVVADPVGNGLVRSLTRPGGNATGFSNVEPTVAGKYPELLRELHPPIAHIAVLGHPETLATRTFLPHVEAAARELGLVISNFAVRGPDDIRAAAAATSRTPHSALVVLPSIVVSANWEVLLGSASEYRLPAIYSFGFFARQGGFASYGLDVPHLFREAAGYADRILRGARPADLPVQQPSKFELIINLKTAASLGITVPRAMQLRADEVLE